MKKIFAFCPLLFCLSLAMAQDASNNPHQADFELGSGLNFNFNEGNYQFRLGGMIQPSISFEQAEDEDADYFLNAKRTYFNFSGKAVQEKVSFFLQTNFSLSDPLLDAWVGFHPTEKFNLYFGQKQTVANNREMMVMENYLQFPNRSLLSQNLSNTGREFGLFLDYEFGSDFLLIPQIAVTSGDGRNSFGSDSRDVDLGGLKYGARLDLYPLGAFAEGNHESLADLAHEESLKLVLGAAASFNDGCSNQVGEGHGDFFLYNAKGENQLPDYRQLYSDLLLKYRGFSLLGEYAISSATNLNGTFLDLTANNELDLTQISSFLALGTALNVQLGYVTKKGYALDIRYSSISPEFDQNAASILIEQNAITLGLSKYLKGNDLKLQTSITSLSTNITNEERQSLRGELLLSLSF